MEIAPISRASVMPGLFDRIRKLLYQQQTLHIAGEETFYATVQTATTQRKKTLALQQERCARPNIVQ